MNTTYLKELDGIRGIAALMVMFFHLFNSGYYPNFLMKVSSFGQTGVTLFFVLSGFLITRILFKTVDSSNYFKIFYIRRALRIFPLYFLFLGLFYLLTPYLKDVTNEQQMPTWYYWCFLQNLPQTFNWHHYGPDHYWSLAVEEHFYLVLPFAVYFLGKMKIKNYLYGAIFFTILLRILFIWKGYSTYYFTLTTMDSLAMGALLAFYESKNVLEKISKKNALFILLFSLPVLAILWLFVNSKAIALVQVFKFSIISFIYVVFIFYVMRIKQGHLLKKILLSWPIQHTGKISYGLYVYHPMCFLIVQKFIGFKGYLIDFLLSFGLAFTISSLSYHVFEAKILRFKKYFNYEPKPILATGTARIDN